MSKKAQRFEQGSGWTARDSGGGHKGETRRLRRADISEGSSRMADGGAVGGVNLVQKERLLANFRQWRAEKKLGKRVRCPICQLEIGVNRFECHVRRV
jgi:hypothetical protein